MQNDHLSSISISISFFSEKLVEGGWPPCHICETSMWRQVQALGLPAAKYCARFSLDCHPSTISPLQHQLWLFALLLNWQCLFLSMVLSICHKAFKCNSVFSTWEMPRVETRKRRHPFLLQDELQNVGWFETCWWMIHRSSSYQRETSLPLWFETQIAERIADSHCKTVQEYL